MSDVETSIVFAVCFFVSANLENPDFTSRHLSQKEGESP
jgi:hypothetical protein